MRQEHENGCLHVLRKNVVVTPALQEAAKNGNKQASQLFLFKAMRKEIRELGG